VIDTPGGAALADATDASALRLIGHDIAVAASAWIAAISGPSEQLMWLHANHLGAIEAATDQHAQPMWQADYAAFGRVQIKPMHDASSDASSDTSSDSTNHTTPRPSP
jgi:hypothetical protein